MNTACCIASIALVGLVSLASCDKKSEPGMGVRDTTPATSRPDTLKPTPAPAPVVNNPAIPAPAVDNTVRNKVDGAGDTKTPLDQSEAAADIKVTADIRRAILSDKNMSMNAQNCKIITDKQGMVTLRGVVNTQAEKDSIETLAKGIAGASHVDNQLEVKTN